jgi:hypothetical protein
MVAERAFASVCVCMREEGGRSPPCAWVSTRITSVCVSACADEDGGAGRDDAIACECVRVSVHVWAGSAGPYYYGPYASFAPTADVGTAVCSAAESDLLASTYGDLRGYAYAASVRAFAADMASTVLDHVDRYGHHACMYVCMYVCVYVFVFV